MPSGRGQPGKPLRARCRNSACTAGVHGPASRRTVSSTRTAPPALPPSRRSSTTAVCQFRERNNRCSFAGGTGADPLRSLRHTVRHVLVLGDDGEKLQVKARVVSDPVQPGPLQLSPFRSFGFDSAVILLLSATDYPVSRASKVPCH